VRARSVRLFVSFVAALAGVGACNALTGAGDFHTRADDAKLEEAGSGGDGAGGGGGGEVPVDAGSDEPAEDASTLPPPTCACVAAPPSGWIGPVSLLRAEAAEPASCPAGLTAAMSGGAEFEVPEPGCQPCTCKLENACKNVTVQPHVVSCTSQICGDAGVVGSSCTPLSYCWFQSAAIVTAFGQGSCTPSGGARRPATWKSTATACTFSDEPDGGITDPLNGGCESGLACAPKVAGVEAATCIVREGDHQCPAGPYSVRSTFGRTLSDTRTCSTCKCGTPDVTCTGGEVTVYNDDTCQNAVDVVPAGPTTCETFVVATATGSAKLTKTPTVADGGCPPSGGVVTGGSVTRQSPWTACCLP